MTVVFAGIEYNFKSAQCERSKESIREYYERKSEERKEEEWRKIKMPTLKNLFRSLVSNVLVLIISICLNNAVREQDSWTSFKLTHNKIYETEAIEMIRKLAFSFNEQQVRKHNAANAITYTIGVTKLADLSAAEAARLLNGFRGAALEQEMKAGLTSVRPLLLMDDWEAPDELDWRKVPGRVSSVKDQGLCGSCWAFAAVGGLEGQQGKVKNASRLNFEGESLVELSAQNLLDCDYEDFGCGGGHIHKAYEFIEALGGLNEAAEYPYEANEARCRFRKEKVAASARGAALLPEGDEEALKRLVANFGPVPVAINASHTHFHLYKFGVYNPDDCSGQLADLDHAVLLVGYGSDAQLGDYWIIKNSFGTSWGEEGYMRMARNKNNKCGVATHVVVPY